MADQTVTEPGGTSGDRFGGAVALSADGSTLVVGAPYDAIGGNAAQGSVHVYTWSGTGWVLRGAGIVASDGAAGDHFGQSVAVSADGLSVLVGAGRDDLGRSDQGSARLYSWNGAAWVQRGGTMSPLLPESGAASGTAVALSADGNTAWVGAPLDDVAYKSATKWVRNEQDDHGSATRFVWDGGAWQQRSTGTTPRDGNYGFGEQNDHFGAAVATSADGNTLVLAGPNDDVGGNTDQGSVRVFVNNGSSFVQKGGPITPGDGAAYDLFGTSAAVSSSGNTVIIGGPGDDVGGLANAGSARVFDWSGTAWVQRGGALTPVDGAVYDGFGQSVALSADGNIAIVGGPGDDVGGDANQGSAHVFAWDGTSWTQRGAALTPGDGARGDGFGGSVALSADGLVAVIGGAGDDVGANADQGSVRSFFWTGSLWVETGRLDPIPAILSIAPLSAQKAEGNSGSTAFTFTISRGGDTGVATTVGWSVAGDGGNVADATDFAGGTLPTGSVSFLAGETSKTITINVAGDTSVEQVEEFSVTLGNPTVGIVSGGAAIGRILPDDGPTLPGIAYAVDGAASDRFGYNIDVSADGRFLAASAPYDALNGNTGTIRVMEWDGAQWVQRGDTVSGPSYVGISTGSVHISDDGSTVFASAQFGAANGVDRAGASVAWDWSGTAWVQRGGLITDSNAAANDYWGVGSGMSADGDTVLITSFSNGNNGGLVFDWSGSAWVQRGGIITSPDASGLGTTAAMDAAGDTVVLGHELSSQGGNASGSARVFDWNGTAWVQRGGAVLPAGTATQDRWSSSVDISDDGNSVLLGSWRRDVGGNTDQGAAAVFDWNGSAWVQRGALITDADGATQDYFGYQVRFTHDARTVIIGASGDEPAGPTTLTGTARVFDWNGAAWVQRGAPVSPTDRSVNGVFGSTSTISADGNTAYVGIADQNVFYNGQGTVRSFSWTGTAWVEGGPALISLVGDSQAEGATRSVTITRAGDLSSSADINWAVTATGARPVDAADFTGSALPTGTAQFAAGEATLTITLSIANDTTAEWDETFQLTVTGAANSGLGTFGQTFTVLTDDGNPAGLTASDGQAGDRFAAAVATSLDGRVVALGGPRDDVGAQLDQGSARVMLWTGTAWVQRGGSITAADGQAGDLFGSALALSADGNALLVGSPGDSASQGSARLFDWNGTGWVQRGGSLAGSGGSAGQFGAAVALADDGLTAIIGSAGETVGANAGQGAARVFAWNGTAWAQRGTSITAADGAGGDALGRSVALSADGNVAIIGADGDDVGGNANQGSARVFVWNGTAWVARGAALTPTDGAANDGFGGRVALSADGTIAAVAGALDDVSGRADQGSVRVFTWNGTAWTQRGAAITPADGLAGDQWGTSLALSADGSIVTLGGPNLDVSGQANQGGGRSFAWNGTAWVQRGGNLTAADGTAGDGFGNSLAASRDGATVILGSGIDDVAGHADQGAARALFWNGTAWVESGPALVSVTNDSIGISEGNGGSTAFTFTLTRSGTVAGEASIGWSVEGAGAHPADAADFAGGTLSSGTVNFAAGQTSATITVNVAGDTGAEADEGFALLLGAPNGVAIGVGSAGSTILNDDARVADAGGGMLPGAFGNDTLQGGPGVDLVDYSGNAADQPVQANLAAGTADDGQGGTDTLLSIENLTGGGGGDVLIGDDGPNALNGGSGSDTLAGGGGNDTLSGGAGVDTADYSGSGPGEPVIASLTSGGATDGQGGLDTLLGIENLTGGAGDDQLTGDGAANILDGGDGDDRLDGQGGDDTLVGGAGRDVLEGGAGNDLLYDPDPSTTLYVGGAGTDRVLLDDLYLDDTGRLTGVEEIQTNGFDILGGDGAERLDFSGFAIFVNDTAQGGVVVDAGGGDDAITGSQREDMLLGGTGNDTLAGAGGNDTLSGGEGQDSMAGDAGEDSLSGGAGNDTLDGGAGNDTLDGGAGDDSLAGGAGFDLVSYAGTGTGVNIDLTTGLATGAGQDTLSGIEAVLGGDGSDMLTGDAAANQLDGGAGDDVVDGGAGNDTLLGGLGNDTLSFASLIAGVSANLATGSTGATAGIDVISGFENLRGGAGNDSLSGDASGNVIEGGAGADLLDGAAGNDSLLGGDGADTLFASLGTDTLGGDADDDVLDLSRLAANATLNLGTLTAQQVQPGVTVLLTTDADTGRSDIENVTGGDGNDSLTGDAGDNTLLGAGGNDTLVGAAGHDALDGGAGNDSLSGGSGNDTLHAGTGTDALSGGADLDTLDFSRLAANVSFSLGTLTAQTVQSGASVVLTADGATGRADIENLVGGAGNDALTGDAGNNSLSGGAGNDTLSGGIGSDTLAGGAGNDSLSGGADNDTIIFAAGADTVDGGAGTDILRFDGIASGFLFSLQLSTAQVISAGNLVTLTQASGFASTEGLAGGTGNDTLGGDARDNVLEGGAGDDQLYAVAGNDALLGGAGNDTLYGGVGNDTMTGGTGDDTYIVDDAGDLVIELAGGGSDTIHVGVANYALPDNVELVRLFGGALAMTGSVGSETIVVNPVGGSVDGGGGDDVLLGQAGNDNILGGAGRDTLNGGAGADTMQGGADDDTYVVDSVGDQVLETADDGFDTVFVTVDGWSVGPHIEVVYLAGTATSLNGGPQDDQLVAHPSRGSTLDGGAGNDTLWGGLGNDLLRGGAGDDVIRAGAGGDTLNGGAGNDQLVGGTGADTLVFDPAGWGYDQVFDFEQGVDQLRLPGLSGGFAQVELYEIAGSTAVMVGQNRIDVYGVIGLALGDFTFV